MTITCPNCRTDFTSNKLSTEKVNVVLCPRCGMVFPYTVKQSSNAIASVAPTPLISEVITAPAKKKNIAALFDSNLSSGSEDFLRLKEIEEKREILRRERELRYEQKALEYRLRLLEEKERLELRESERRRALEAMEGFVRVTSVTVSAEKNPAQPVAEAELKKISAVHGSIGTAEPETPAVINAIDEAAAPLDSFVAESEPSQAAFEFEKTTAAQTVKPSEAVIGESLNIADSAEEVVLETESVESASEFLSGEPPAETGEELKIESDEKVPAEEIIGKSSAASEEALTEAVTEDSLPVIAVEAEAENCSVQDTVKEEYALVEEEYEAVVVAFEDGEDEEETAVEVRLIDDSEENSEFAGSRLVEKDTAAELPEEGAAETLSDVAAVVERVRLIEEEACRKDSDIQPESIETAAAADEVPLAEAPYYASGETVTEHGLARVIVTGVKLLDEEAPAEDAAKEEQDVVDSFFAQVEDEAERVSDGDLEASLKADVDQVVSEIEGMEFDGAASAESFGHADAADEVASEYLPSEDESQSTEEESPAIIAAEETLPEKIEAVAEESVEKKNAEPEFVVRPVDLSPEEIQLRQEQERARRRATQQFYSSQFKNIKMQRDIERRILEEKEKLAAEAAEQKNPAGTELSRMKRNLQIGAALFAVLIVAQVLIYIFGRGN